MRPDTPTTENEELLASLIQMYKNSHPNATLAEAEAAAQEALSKPLVDLQKSKPPSMARYARYAKGHRNYHGYRTD